MIRFCDKEVCCISEKELDRKKLVEYFLDGHRKELVCVLDERGKFVGSISYPSLLGRELDEAISCECITLNDRVWEEGRKCFKRYHETFAGIVMIPIVNEEQELLCFAYQDNEANQELRMLDELVACKKAIGFRDIYNEFDRVIVHGCNELAYYFAAYLKLQGVSVQISGDLWQYFNLKEEIIKDKQNEVLDYRILNIYAEGIYPIEKKSEQRRSVSVEFEIVDKIYEKNILSGIIRNEKGNIKDVFQLMSDKPIAILGTDDNALNTYDFLLANGIDICCFITNAWSETQPEIFGKIVVSRAEAMNASDEFIFVQGDKKYSAWGFGETNLYHYFGYERNEKFILLQDYVDIPNNGFINILGYWVSYMPGRMVLLGDPWMCLMLENALSTYVKRQNNKIVYCDILNRYAEEDIRMLQIQEQELEKKDFCLLLMPKYFGCYFGKKFSKGYRTELIKKYRDELKRLGIDHLRYYPYEKMEWAISNDTMEVFDSKFKIQRIVLGAINGYSGNLLFGGILDGHPQIIQMRNGYLSENMYYLCMRLCKEPVSKIPAMLWKIYGEGFYKDEEFEFPQRKIFNDNLKKLLKEKENVTSQELFVIFHIAYARMLEKKIDDISNMTIYWEPHSVPRNELEQYATWLNPIKNEGYIVNIVRNSYARFGSAFRGIAENRPMNRMRVVMEFPILQKEYANWTRIILKFENLKCNPKKEMLFLCKETGITWSDTFLNVGEEYSIPGTGVYGFDLTPVYRVWEEYFSSFDRFRINILTGPWLKKYGYPYGNSLEFNRRELLEMFLKKFRFEENYVFVSEELKQAYLSWRQKIMNELLWEIRRKNILEG